jgi:hypothetical protein
MAASTVSRVWLDWVAELASESALSSALRANPDRFACLLEDQPSMLVPQRFLDENSGQVEKVGSGD